jgi:hypothetical protein
MEELSNTVHLHQAVCSLFSSGSISNREKFRLEEMISQSDTKIRAISSEFASSPNSERLKNGLSAIVTDLRKHPGRILIPLAESNQEVMSPLGTFLLQKKKNRTKSKQLTLTLYKTDSQDSENLQN